MPKPIFGPNETPTGRLFGDLRFVVAGTPRGGTTFTANVLKDLGLRSKHEGLLNDRRHCHEYSRYYDCEISGGNALMLKEAKSSGVKVFHLIRNPVKTINSMIRRWGTSVRGDNGGKPYWIGSSDLPLGTGIANWWLNWRTIIEDAGPVATFSLENIEEGLIIIRDEMGYDWSEGSVREAISKNLTEEKMSSTNSWPRSPHEISWVDLPLDVKEFAERHGYGGI